MKTSTATGGATFNEATGADPVDAGGGVTGGGGGGRALQ